MTGEAAAAKLNVTLMSDNNIQCHISDAASDVKLLDGVGERPFFSVHLDEPTNIANSADGVFALYSRAHFTGSFCFVVPSQLARHQKNSSRH